MSRLLYITLLPLVLLAAGIWLLVAGEIGEATFVAYLAFTLVLSFGGYVASSAFARSTHGSAASQIEPGDTGHPRIAGRDDVRVMVEDLAHAMSLCLAADSDGQGEPRLVKRCRSRDRIRDLLDRIECERSDEVLADLDESIADDLRKELADACWDKVRSAPRPRPKEQEFKGTVVDALKDTTPGNALAEVRRLVEAHTILSTEISRRTAYYDYFSRHGRLHPEYRPPNDG